MPKIDITDPRITFARVTINVDGEEIFAKSISYSDGTQFSQVEGNAGMSLGTTDGLYAADEGTISLYADEAAQVVEKFGDKFYEKTFTVSVAYEKSGSSQLTKDELIGVRWTKRSVNDQSGGDGLTRDFSYKPAYIKWNGKNPRSKMPAGAN
ncbi:hypothetical protein [Deinococcus radiotolerans]|uniref:Uncharacterized protein n=1 Tax=Deinococcus radiotolerans TaxID=1309407 RepID=A0ABQ2FQ86_9DEIO|nr:hypothetical protein [Deinococcus radiotolerans]GGL15893.1 hypothetical protein GCM10010844_38490 [Deinococcus radiotolerans]